MRAFRYLLIVIFVICFGCGPALADKRIALIMGNSAYKNVPKLSNPANDAALVGRMLRTAGFDSVDIRFDLDVADMRKSLRDFGAKARDADVAVVYYAGHGIELDGTNYLIPTDAVLETDSDVLDEAIPLDRVLFAVEAAKQLRLVILDACRDNPFAKTMKRSIASRAIGRGLAKVEPSSPNTLIAFSAKAGSTASDGDSQDSPFALAVVERLPTPGLDLRRAFGFVRDDVLKTTGYKQEPYVYGSLGGEDVSLVPAAAPVAAVTTGRDEVMRRDYEFAERVGTKPVWDAFIERYPSGFYTALAKAHRDKLAADAVPNQDASRLTTTQENPSGAAPQRPQPGVATLAPAEKPDQPASSELPRLLQSELRRVGCSTSTVDGNWDAAWQRSLERFNKHAGTKLDTKVVSIDALDAVRSRPGRICPLLCEPGYRNEDESCVKITCRAGQRLSAQGRCEEQRSREPAVSKGDHLNPGKADTAGAKPQTGGRCTSISQRCAIQIGGRCNPSTGHWEYGRNGAGGNTQAFDSCVSQMLAAGKR